MNAQPKSLLPRHRVMMRMQLRGLTHGEIAETLGISVATVKYITGSDIYQAELEKLQAAADGVVVAETVDVNKKIEELTGKSIKALEDMLSSTETADKLKADICWDILDRGGYKAVEKKQTVNEHHVYVDSLQRAFERRKLLQSTAQQAIADESDTDAL